MKKQYETVIGLEVHVELLTKTKIFCGCVNKFGGARNAYTCPVCTGMPGALPVLNKKVVEYAIAVGIACGCSITKNSKFDRKNYFYPDNPQNYQISQLYVPICRNGKIEIETENGKKEIGICEIHMEEDAGKLVHDEVSGCSVIDYNRSGVPLIEIVSKPDMRCAQEVLSYLETLRLMIQYLGVSDCKLNEGSMRADVNLSVREKGSTQLGTRTEMKNLNSFKAITRAIEHEKNRQIQLLEQGEKIVQETRRWDDKNLCSYSMRSKEDAKDYRYFPEPDLVPIVVSDAWIEEVKAKQPQMRGEKLKYYQKQFGLPEYDAKIITGHKKFADLFEETVKICKNPKKVSNWIMGEVIRLLRENEMDASDIAFSPENFAKLIDLTEQGVINHTAAKEVFEQIFKYNIEPEQYVKEHGLSMVQDNDALKKAAVQVIKENPKPVTDYKNGKQQVIGFLVGQTMKAMQGKANPEKVREILKELL